MNMICTLPDPMDDAIKADLYRKLIDACLEHGYLDEVMWMFQIFNMPIDDLLNFNQREWESWNKYSDCLLVDEIRPEVENPFTIHDVMTKIKGVIKLHRIEFRT